MAGDSNKQWTDRKTRKYFRCGSVDHLIAKCLKPTKYHEK